jgi:hypothetical protein
MSEEKQEVPKLLKKAAFAALLGCAPSYVTNLGKAGRLVMSDAKRVLVMESLASIVATAGGRGDVAERWAASRETGDVVSRCAKLLAGFQAVAVIPEPPAAAPSAPTAAETAAAGEVEGFRQSRAESEARKAKAQADQEEMKAAQMRGDLIPREEVEAALTFVGGAVRGALDLLPDQTAPVVAPVTALDEVHAILQDASRNALEAVGQAITRQRAELAKGAKA